MRSFASVCVLLTLAACATPRAVTPREYLDETTAATVTVVADPWIYSEQRTRSAAAEMPRASLAPERRDFLSVYAIDVNRMGIHRQYFAVLQSLPRVGKPDIGLTLELRTAGQTLALQPVTMAPRELGIAQAPAPAGMSGSRWWYFPVDRNVLTAIGGSRDLQAALLVDGERIAYDIWRDGSAELAELAAMLP